MAVTPTQVSTAISTAIREEDSTRIPEITQSRVTYEPNDYFVLGNSADGTFKMLAPNLFNQISSGLNLDIPAQITTAIDGSLSDILGDIADINRKIRNINRSNGVYVTHAELNQVSESLKTYIDGHIDNHPEGGGGDGGIQSIITNDPVLGDGTRNTSTEDPNRVGPVRLDEQSGIFFGWLTDRTEHLSDDEKRLFREGINAAEAPHDHDSFVERGQDFEDQFDLSKDRNNLVSWSRLQSTIGDMNTSISSFYSTKLYVNHATDALIEYIDSLSGIGGGTVGSNSISLTTFHNQLAIATNAVKQDITGLSNSVYRTVRTVTDSISGLEDSISGLSIPTAFDPAEINQAITGIRGKVTGVSNSVVGENEISNAISSAVSGLSGVSTSVAPFNPTNLQKQITTNRVNITNVSNALYDLSGDVGVISTSIKNSIVSVSNRNRAYTRDQMGSVQTQVNDLDGELNTLSGAVSTHISQFNVVSTSLSQYATTGGVSTAVSNLSTAIINYIDGLDLTGSGTVGQQGVTLNQVQTLITNATTAVSNVLSTEIDGNSTRITNLEGSQITAQQVSTAVTGGVTELSSAVDARFNGLSFLTGVNANTDIFDGNGTAANALNLRNSSVLLQHIGISTSTQKEAWREAILAVSAQDVSGYVEPLIPDANRLIPGGGNSGQVLKRLSNNPYDTGWRDDNTGGGGGGGDSSWDTVNLESPLSGFGLQHPGNQDAPFSISVTGFIHWTENDWDADQKSNFVRVIGAEPARVFENHLISYNAVSGDVGSLIPRVEDIEADNELVSSSISNSIHSLSGNVLQKIELTQTGLESEITGLSSSVSNAIANLPRGGGASTSSESLYGERIGTWTWSTNKWSTFVPNSSQTDFSPTGNSAGIVRFSKTNTGILDNKFLGFSIISWSSTNRNNSDLISKSIITLADFKAVRGGASIGRSIFVGSSNEELFVTLDDQSGQYQIKLDQTAFTGTVTGQILDLVPIFASAGHGIVTSVDSPLSIVNGELDIFASPWTTWVEGLNWDKKKRIRQAVGGKLRGIGALPTINQNPSGSNVSYNLGDCWCVPHDDLYEIIDSTSSSTAIKDFSNASVTSDGTGDDREYEVEFTIVGSTEGATLVALRDKLRLVGDSELGKGNSFLVEINNVQYLLTDDAYYNQEPSVYSYSVRTTNWAFTQSSDLVNSTISSKNLKVFPAGTTREWSPMGIGTDGLLKSAEAPLILDKDGRLSLETDDTLSVDNQSRLKVARPFTLIDEEKLDNLRSESRDLFSTTLTVGSSTPGQNQWSLGVLTGFGDSAADDDGNWSTFGAIANNTVSINGTNHRIYAIYQNTDEDEISMFIEGNPNLDGYELEIGDNFLAFSQAYNVEDTGDTGEVYSIYNWHTKNIMPASGSANVALKINKPISESDYLPADGVNGRLLAYQSNAPAWIVGTDRLLPTGGTIKQVLVKTGPSDYQIEWQDQSGNKVPSGNALPTTNPADGDQYILTSHENIPTDHVFRVTQSQGTLRQITLGTGSGLPHFIYAYATGITGPNQALANKVYVVYSGARTKTASKLIFHSDKNIQQSYTVSQSIEPGFQHWYRVTGLNYNSLQAAREYFVNIEFTDGTKLYPDKPYVLGHYVYSATNGWEPLPGVAAWWATQGMPRPAELLAVTKLIDGAGDGVTTTSGDTASRTAGAPVLFNPEGDSDNFDLDDSINTSGIFQVEATLRFASRSHTTIGFGSDGLVSQRKTGFLFASSVRASAEYSATQPNGVLVNTWRIENTSGSVHIGDVELYITKNANNLLGYYYVYKVADGGSSYNFGISPNMRVVFLHNDGEGAPQNFTGLVDTPDALIANKWLKVNDDGTAVIQVSAPELTLSAPREEQTNGNAQIYFTTDGESGSTLTGANTWSGWKEIWRHQSENTKKILLAGLLNPVINWTATDGADRVFVEVRCRQVTSLSQSTTRFIATSYIRNIPDVSNASKSESIPVSQIIDFSQGAFLYLEARVIQQSIPSASDRVNFSSVNYLRSIELGN